MNRLISVLAIAVVAMAFLGCRSDSDQLQSVGAGPPMPSVDSILSPLVEPATELIGPIASSTDWTNVERVLENKLFPSEVFRDIENEYLFFNKGHCFGSVRGSFWTRAQGEESINLRDVSWFKDNEVASVLIRGAKKGEVIHLHNDPSGTDASKGHVVIRIHRDITSPICLGTFEIKAWYPSRSDPAIEVAFQGAGRINGRVSRVANYTPE